MKRPFLPWETAVSMLAYVVLLLGAIELLDHVDVPSPWREAVALSPILALVGVVWGVLRQLRRMDEMWRRIQLEALGFAFAGTAVLTFSYGFLEGLGYARLSMFVVLPVMCALWCVGLALARRRYR